MPGLMALREEYKDTKPLKNARIVGEYKDGKRNGQGTFTATDGSIYKGIWEKDELVEPN